MSFRTQVVADNKSITKNGGEEIKLTPPGESAETQTVTGLVYRIDEQADPITGQRIHEPKTAVAIHASEIEGTPDEDWTVETTDGAGNAIVGKVASPRRDWTINMWVLILEVDE